MVELVSEKVSEKIVEALIEIESNNETMTLGDYRAVQQHVSSYDESETDMEDYKTVLPYQSTIYEDAQTNPWGHTRQVPAR